MHNTAFTVTDSRLIVDTKDNFLLDYVQAGLHRTVWKECINFQSCPKDTCNKSLGRFQVTFLFHIARNLKAHVNMTITKSLA